MTVCKISLYTVYLHRTPNVSLLVCCSVVSLYHYTMITYGMPLKNMNAKVWNKKAMRRNEQCKQIHFDFLFTTKQKTWSPLKDL